MLVLGLLVLAATVVAAVELVLANNSQVTFSMWNQTWHFDAYWLAAIGAAIVVAAVLGLWMMRMGTARQWRLRRERRELAEENRRLAERAAKASATPAATPAATPTATTATAGRDGVPANRANAGYPAAPAYPAGAPAPGAYPAADAPAYGTPAAGAHTATGNGEEHRGFFARHAMSGRRQR